jgi:indole-3-glycerol phosphate synthase
MTTILDSILAAKRDELARAKSVEDLAALERAVEAQQDYRPRGFHAALRRGSAVQLIAEVKRSSPSAGTIRSDVDPVAIAMAYQDAGAACISVLTDQPYFGGSLEDLRAVRQAVRIPVLRKDFIIERYQLLQARLAHADAVLLIAECLSPKTLRELHQQAIDLGLDTLIELYDIEHVPSVIASGGTLVGVNNRDLRTFTVDLHHTIRVGQQLPADCTLVGESGIRTAADVAMLGQHGVKAVLVGESLMRQPDLRAAAATLTGHPSRTPRTTSNT